ncbi:cytochrome P450 [Streptomyces sp. NRRL F-4474]|uniref:cytochrome P450 n=1 Tax=Streptomyces sp. NRRL F-4474 TaxID=1463851 RepID=UPI0004C9CDB9|nr:cytochrome P450 [Streptomyces sp. NRRL F-4474]
MHATLPAQSPSLLSEEFARSPHPHYRRLREQAPAWWDAETECWYVTSYREVNALLRDTRLSARIGSGFFGDLDAAARAGIQDVVDFFDSWPMFTDPPAHTRVRSAAGPGYRPAGVGPLREWIAREARELLAGCDPRETDLLGRFVHPLAVSVTCRLLGIDDEHRESVLSWSCDIIDFIGVPQCDPDRAPASRAAILELQDYLRTVILPMARAGQGPPQIRAFLDLDPQQGAALYAQLLTGGIEPVAASLGSALVSLLDEAGDVLDRLHRGSLDAGQVAEEALRYDAPFHFVPRTATEPIEVAGATIRPGERVALVVAAANRDPAVFADPDRFRIPAEGDWDRPHLSFGAGHHFCLGAGIARATLTEAIAAFAEWTAGRPVGPIAADRSAAFCRTVWQRVAVGL